MKKYCISYHLKRWDGTEIYFHTVNSNNLEMAVSVARSQSKRLSKKLRDVVYYYLCGEDIAQIGVSKEVGSIA